jgi:2'-5' RNA ligase
MNQISATNFQKVYEALGIDTGKLGCLMIDVQPVVVNDIISEEDLYYADPEKHKWIQGIVSEDIPHCTVLYGFLRSAKELQPHLTTLLEGVKIETLKIKEIHFFHSNEKGENYKTIIALIEPTEELLEANARASMLPHLNTFTSYMPHITLAYVKDSCDYMGYIAKLNEVYKGKTIKALDWNFGI